MAFFLVCLQARQMTLCDALRWAWWVPCPLYLWWVAQYSLLPYLSMGRVDGSGVFWRNENYFWRLFLGVAPLGRSIKVSAAPRPFLRAPRYFFSTPRVCRISPYPIYTSSLPPPNFRVLPSGESQPISSCGYIETDQNVRCRRRLFSC